MKRAFRAGLIGFVLLAGTIAGHAEQWVKNSVDVPNQNVEANYYDVDSVKVKDKTLSWTEKFVMTDFGAKSYAKHLQKYPLCRENMEKSGPVAYHKIDFEIRQGKFRTVAKRNYTRDNTELCTDKDMGKELDTAWHDIVYGGPMYNRHYILVTRFKLGDI